MLIELSNAMIDEYTLTLAKKIKTSGKKYNSLFPIPMAGYPIAIRLSNYLDLPIIHSYPLPSCLIIDDIVNTGKTMQKYDRYDRAVLIVRPDMKGKVMFYVKQIKDPIQFPWETD